MSWNFIIYLFIMQYFLFLVSFKWFFIKFSINNLLLFLVFGLFYFFLIGFFQNYYQGLLLVENLLYFIVLILGSFMLVFGYLVYFNFINCDIFYYYCISVLFNLVNMYILFGCYKVDLDYIKFDCNCFKVFIYLGENLWLRLVCLVVYYELCLLFNIFK